MALEEPIQFVIGLDTQQLTQLRFGKTLAPVLLDSQGLNDTTRKIVARHSGIEQVRRESERFRPWVHRFSAYVAGQVTWPLPLQPTGTASPSPGARNRLASSPCWRV